MIRQMTEQELKDIYERHMVYDFPDDERKPLQILLHRMKKNQNMSLCYIEDDVIKGYSILEYCQGNKCLLMDYFAIFEEERHHGVGTRFLEEMKVYFKDWDALIIESECIYDDISKKRIEFYKRAGAKISGAQVHLYHVNYELLVISLRRQIKHHEVKELTDEIYRKIYAGPFRQLFLKWIH